MPTMAADKSERFKVQRSVVKITNIQVEAFLIFSITELLSLLVFGQQVLLAFSTFSSRYDCIA